LKTRGEKLAAIGLTITFLKDFGLSLWLTSPLLLSLAAVMTMFGLVAGKREGGHALTASTGHSSPQPQ
jgi:hypothetical protein